MEKTILFFLKYEERERSCKMLEYDTVGNLKSNIEILYDIPPDRQIIEGWKQVPQGDYAILQSCTDIDNINVLTIRLANDETREKWTQDDDKSILAAISGCEKIIDVCGESGVEFHCVSLENAIAQSCLTSLEERRVLLLYLHNENEAFSKIFFKHLKCPKVRDILNNSFYLLAWDVANEKYHDDLELALNVFDLPATILVRNKKCAVLLIQNIDGCLTCVACLTQNENFLLSLENVAALLNAEKAEEEKLADLEDSAGNDNDMDSYKYQKLMADMLGDRDYDCFEFNQHKYLKDKIAYSLVGPPVEETGYDRKVWKKVEVVYKAIMKNSNKIAEFKDQVQISFIWNCTEPLPKEKNSRAKKFKDYNPNTDIMPMPIFVLRKCRDATNPCRIFIDDIGRTYKSWRDYIENNKLHECKMVLPRNGRYEVDDNGEVLLETHLSPACGLHAQILKGTDVVSAGAGLITGGIFIASAITSITLAPAVLVGAGIVGIGAGGYAIGRSIHTLVDRSKYDESLSFANSEARGAYINILAGSLGFAGAGANFLVSTLAARGVNIGEGIRITYNTLNVTNLVASGAGIANSSYDIFDQWINENRTPSLLTVIQLGSSVLFFGNAVYNYKNMTPVVDESHVQALQDYQESLRSNRHRKTFNKLMKETIRQNNGNEVQARAEVVSAIRSISNKDELFAALTRSNKAMNKNGVKFYASNGSITLNGQPINLNDFGTSKQVDTFLSKIPPMKQVAPIEIKSVENLFLAKGLDLVQLGGLASRVLILFIKSDGSVQEFVVDAAAELLRHFTVDIKISLKEMFPNQSQKMNSLIVAFEFFASKAAELEKQYDQWRSTGDSQYYQTWFGEVDKDNVKQALWFFRQAVMACSGRGRLSEMALKELLGYFYNWFAQKFCDYQERQESEENRRVHSARYKPEKMTCTICNGCYYEIK